MNLTIDKNVYSPSPDSVDSRPLRGAVTAHMMLLMVSLLFLVVPFDVMAAPEKETGPPPLVTVVTVTEQDVNPPKEFVGHVEALQSVDLQARVGGFLQQVNFKEGSEVSVGDLLYVIEQAPYRAKVAAARARVAKSEATYSRSSNYLKRIEKVRTGSVSAADTESAKADQLEAGAELQEAKASLTLAELDLGYTRILAPISGRIGATALTAGNLCGPTTGPLAKIVQLDPIRIQYSISENDLSAIRAALDDSKSGQEKGLVRSQIRLPGGEILDLNGRVDFVDNVVDATTGTISVRLLFDNPAGRLLPGQYVTVLISWQQPKPMAVVPQAAILEDREGRYVLAVNEEDQVEQRRVITGPLTGTLWAIESGLTPGEAVIVQGLQKVKPGQTVKTTTADAASRTD